MRKRRPRRCMPNVVGNTRLSDVLMFVVATLSVVAEVTDGILHEIAFKNALVNGIPTCIL